MQLFFRSISLYIFCICILHYIRGFLSHGGSPSHHMFQCSVILMHDLENLGVLPAILGNPKICIWVVYSDLTVKSLESWWMYRRSILTTTKFLQVSSMLWSTHIQLYIYELDIPVYNIYIHIIYYWMLRFRQVYNPLMTALVTGTGTVRLGRGSRMI